MVASPSSSRRFLRAAPLLLAILLATCAHPPVPRPPALPTPVTQPEAALRPVALPPLLDDADWGSLSTAVDHSLTWLRRQPPDRIFVFGPRTLTAAAEVRALAGFQALLADNPTPATLASRVAERFDILAAAGGVTGEVLVTGYYEATLEASLERRPGYETALYRPPDDLVQASLGEFAERLRGERIAGRLDGRKLVPYWTRGEICDRDILSGRGLELAWARNPVEAFFLEVQGSGTLILPDGREQRVGYAAANGRTYRSIGRLLAAEGRIAPDRVSMQTIAAWLAEHPEDHARVFAYNESMVFFEKLTGPPLGNLGQPVTPGRSIATDQRLFPPAALGFLVSERPVLLDDGSVASAGPMTRFVLNQDTGGAIRGADRVDFFWGRGAEAAATAGIMKQPGKLYFLVPRN